MSHSTLADPQAELLQKPLQYLKGVGPKRAAQLRRCGLETVWDALNYFPYRHEDRRQLTPIAKVRDGETVTVCGVVETVASRRTRTRKTLVRVSIADDTGVLYATWWNQPWMAERFRQGGKVIFTGKARLDGYPDISNPAVELLPDDFDPEEYAGYLMPVYRLTEDLHLRVMNSVIHAALELALPALDEYLPDKVLDQYRLIPLPDAYRIIHAFECRDEELTATAMARARRRLVVDEFFVIAMGLAMKRRRSEHLPYTIRHQAPGALVKNFVRGLPFTLTEAQRRVVKEVRDDMLTPLAMNRLIQGDVGSGKTVVALIAMLMAFESGYQAALMAPTEVLARQHHRTIQRMLDGLDIPVLLLTSSTKSAARREIHAHLTAGTPAIVVGTHALIQKEVEFPKLGLAVVDEQHKFGVMQRNRLREQGELPDVLVMTATPIPRSLALTVYGDLSVSVIDELPSGRQPIKTYVVDPEMLPRVWKFVRRQITAGHQAYVVYPLIDESKALDAKAATVMFEELGRTHLAGVRLGLLHGRMSATEKEEVMCAFADGSLDTLVATTVIEVGVDVPNATVMVVEEAQRFGLAQLHQLRGRIGRGGTESFCILVDNTPAEERIADPAAHIAQQQELLAPARNSRLAAMAATNDGFVIAEEDLKLRGPGEFFGIEQTGLPALHIADIVADTEELTLARHLADTLLAYRESLRPETREKLRVRLFRAFGTTVRGVDAG